MNNMDKIFSSEDAQFIRLTKGNVIQEELFVTKKDKHKFKVGKECKLVGLEDFPEFNGEVVTISNYREDGSQGTAYYIKGRINEYLNWVYEYRLEK